MAAATKEKTEVEKLNDQIMDALGELGGKRSAAEVVQYGINFQVPSLYRGNLPGAADRLKQIHREMEEEQYFVHELPYKVWDVSVAIVRVFQRTFGVSVVQRSTFFQPSGFRDIPISPTEYVKAPMGNILMPTFSGTMGVSASEDDDGHPKCTVWVNCPKKYEPEVNGLWMLLEDDLKKNSIYRGKAIDSSDMPTFLDLSKVDIERIIYSDVTFNQLTANLWTPIEYPSVCRSHGLNEKRAVLLKGSYGTGKTLAAMWTAKLCQEQRRTFIMCRPGDNPFDCLWTAALYQPACVFVEDIDKLAATDDEDDMSKLLDEFDGLKAKNRDIIMVLTTNQAGAIHKGMLRPGRLDAVITITNHDLDANTRLVKTLFTPEELADDIDFEVIHEAMEGFTPAFTVEVCQKVKLYSIRRIAEGGDEVYTTTDFLSAITEMREHYNLHIGAGELKERPTMDTAVERIVHGKVFELLEQTQITRRGDYFGDLKPVEANGKH